LRLTAVLQPFQRTIDGLGELPVTTSHAHADRELETRFGERNDAQRGLTPRQPARHRQPEESGGGFASNDSAKRCFLSFVDAALYTLIEQIKIRHASGINGNALAPEIIKGGDTSLSLHYNGMAHDVVGPTDAHPRVACGEPLIRWQSHEEVASPYT
jgi:hypothetical protein